MPSYRQIEKMIDVVSNLLVTVLVVATLFEDLGINIVQLLTVTPEMLRFLIQRYFVFFWTCHLTLLVFVLIEGYVGMYMRDKYPEAYKSRYIPTVSTILFILAFLSFLAFRRFLDLFLMICSVACLIGRGS
ncbi:MAG: hypothetical protein DRO40_11110 [Thermoprotei archaeon]|nr:MAG: hypothetical protein DRO40_11110 [Thermoprotei archaeon]